MGMKLIYGLIFLLIFLSIGIGLDIPLKQTPQDRFMLTPHFQLPFLV